MSLRLILGLSVVAVVVGCAALAAPVPRESQKGPRLYFPTTVGAEWVYETPEGQEYTDYLSKAEQSDGATVVTVERCAEGRPQSSETIRVGLDGLFLLANARGKKDPPECMLKLPFKADERWEGYSLLSDPGYVNVAVTEEKVEVPAGTFTAIRVETEETRNGKTQQVWTHWYAPVVGLIKFQGPVSRDRGPTVLKSFKLGKHHTRHRAFLRSPLAGISSNAKSRFFLCFAGTAPDPLGRCATTPGGFTATRRSARRAAGSGPGGRPG
jgi:hypothetical protein